MTPVVQLATELRTDADDPVLYEPAVDPFSARFDVVRDGRRYVVLVIERRSCNANPNRDD